MKELTEYSQWKELVDYGEFIIFISRSSCDSCNAIEEKIENFKSLDIFKISLDNPESFNLRKEISWIRKEVEILPLIGVINRGHLVRKFQGSEVKKALIFLHSLRSLNSEQI